MLLLQPLDEKCVVLQDSGNLVLLDFGQCKALPAARQKALANVIIAMDEGDDLEIALAMSRFGMDFSALGGGVADPQLIRIIAFICFDTRYGILSRHILGNHWS